MPDPPDIGAKSCILKIRARAHNQRVRPFRCGELESDRICSQGVIGAMARNYIGLPKGTDRLPNSLKNGVNFSS